MNRTLVVLALAVFSCAGCRAMGPNRGYGCGDPCGATCAEPCEVTRSAQAPRPCQCGDAGCDACGRGGNLEGNCAGGNCCMFNRYCGHNCGPGYHPGPYDCSPCNSPHWGCTGHRHPMGYRSGQECRMCDASGRPYPCGPDGHPHGHPPGAGYCGDVPAPGCHNSGDHIYGFNPGPPVAQTAYPYYTLRGPRDFLMDNPPSLGPF